MSRFVIINPIRVQIARFMAQAVRLHSPNLVDNLRIKKLYDSFELGFSFEQAVLTLMQHNDVIYEPSITGADNGDLIIKLDNGITITADCKLSCDEESDKLLVPRRQALHSPYHIYIAGRLVDTHQMEVIGYCHPEQLEIAPNEWEMPVDSLYCYYDDMYPIETLLPLIAKGKPRERYPDEVTRVLQD